MADGIIMNGSLWKCPNLVVLKRKGKEIHGKVPVKNKSVSLGKLPLLGQKFQNSNKSYIGMLNSDGLYKPIVVEEPGKNKALRQRLVKNHLKSAPSLHKTTATKSQVFRKDIELEFSSFSMLNYLKQEYNYDFDI